MRLKHLFLIAAMMLTHGVSAYAGSAATVNDTIGAEAMPAEIRPLGELPFKMKDLKRPTFPDKTVTVTQADVNADGKITPAINDMIARLSKSGGGTVVVPEGHWKSGRITLNGVIVPAGESDVFQGVTI